MLVRCRESHSSGCSILIEAVPLPNPEETNAHELATIAGLQRGDPEPDTSFADPELQQGEASTNALGMPMPRSGNFADVYEVRCPNGSRWAVKCFTREVPGLQRALSGDQPRPRSRPSCPSPSSSPTWTGHPRPRAVVSGPQDAVGRGLHPQRVRPRQPRQAGDARRACCRSGDAWRSGCVTPAWPTPTCSTATSCWCPAARPTRWRSS